jgi:RNA-directed DNA polymerase
MQWLDDRSRMSGDVQVRICERLRGRFPRATRLVITGKSRQVLEETVKPAVVAFLRERGLILSEDKTHIVHIDQGFDFLGFNVRKYQGKLLIKPAKKNIKAFLEEMRDIIKSHPTIKTESLIRLLNPKLKGWANYYRHVVSKETFSKVDNQIFQALKRWTKRRHPGRNSKWLYEKYFQHPWPVTWWFHAKTHSAKDKPVFKLTKVAHTKIERHVKIRAEARFCRKFSKRVKTHLSAGTVILPKS